MRRLVVSLLAAAVVVGGAAAGARSQGADRARDERAPGAVATATATVERRTLIERDSVDGTLGYGASRPVVNRGQGTVTHLAAEGTTVDRNGVLYELDGRPVRLLHGDVPAYRRLAADAGDGSDVEQLEANLVAMGFFAATPDKTWSAATTAAVKRWQRTIGVEQDGAVEDGEVVFQPGAVRVASHEIAAGATAQPGAPVMKVTGTAKVVVVALDARKQRLAQPGARAEVTLPDGARVPATVAVVGKVAKSDGDGEGGQGSKPKIELTLTLDDSSAGGDVDGAPVKVRLTRQSREGVLAVPVHALMALPGGRYGVQVVGGRTIEVETGLFAEGWVEVAGDGLAEGTKVVVPK